MYDFYFGEKGDIDKDPKKFLLAIKRMLPRWCNSIPDSEYLALYDLLFELNLSDGSVLVETGSGASSIVLCYFALKTKGQLYSWDISGNKLSFLRSVLQDTLGRYFLDVNLAKHWKYVAYSSISEFAGISMLKELGKKVDAAFLDSEHTWEVLSKEVENVSEVFGDRALLAIDDGNYSYIKYNNAYINMIRKKHSLGPIPDDPKNNGKCFWQAVDGYLKEKFKKVEYLEDNYKKTYQSDIFWSYYKSDRETMSGLAMEKTDDLQHRFDAWKIYR